MVRNAPNKVLLVNVMNNEFCNDLFRYNFHDRIMSRQSICSLKSVSFSILSLNRTIDRGIFSFTKIETQYGMLQYMQSSRGKMILDLNGHQFTMNRQRGPTKYWECSKKRSKHIQCKSRIVTVHNEIKCFTADHNHY